MLPNLDLGFFVLQLYPFFWGLAWAVGFWGVQQNIPEKFRKQNTLYFIGLFICSFLGAKYVFDLSSGNFTFSSGLGFVFYGGLIAAILYLCLLKFFGNSWLSVSLKYLILFLPLSHAIGRVGCYFAGCCYGQLFFPVQLLEAIGLGLIFLYLWKISAKNTVNLLSTYMLLYGVLRLCLEIFRSDARGIWLGMPPSVWISLGLIFSAVVIANSSSGRCK